MTADQHKQARRAEKEKTGDSDPPDGAWYAMNQDKVMRHGL